MTVLGLSCFYHDAAAALVRDGEIVAAAQEERFTRRKHDPSFPTNAAAYCLAEAGLAVADLDAVAFYDKPLLTFERILETSLAYAPRGLGAFIRAMPVWLTQKLWTPDTIRRELGGYDGPLVFSEHHRSHAASAFFPSPFERAAVLTTDGVGEWATTSWGVGDGAGLDIRQEIHFPHSLGLLYSAFTTFCGFRVNSGEYKLMGLAPYGEPRYVDAIREHLIDLRPDGSYRLHTDAFTFATGTRMTGRRFEELFGGPAREPESPLGPREMDLARSVQAVVEDAVLAMARHVHAETGETRLCLAGGVALNCVANGRLLREGPFDEVWVQPAAGDAGGALGAALVAAHEWGDDPRVVSASDAMHGGYLGPKWTPDQIRAALDADGLPYDEHAGDAALVDAVADLLAQGQTVGWFQGRAEFGPRALGHRSILADPRGADVQRRVNLQIKFRESFRPFAPAVLAERAAEFFELGGQGVGIRDSGNAASPGGDTSGEGLRSSIPNPQSPESPYMLLVGPVRGATTGGTGLDKRAAVASALPAVTHVDGSARVQTVTAERNGLFHALLAAFDAKTGCPVLVNTSFNVRGEPIVHAPADAVRVFRRTGMDALAIGPFVVTKAMLPEADRQPFTPDEIAAAYGLD
ncbi:carbamoyltransferase [Rubrivirga sp. IMCC45206]|uniref:carbamoyltransferase family protein n=1 Tax=Rubrivirga sp. IMCC45206 TaxID=3391614 RepID=UPI00398FA5CE